MDGKGKNAFLLLLFIKQNDIYSNQLCSTFGDALPIEITCNSI